MRGAKVQSYRKNWETSEQLLLLQTENDCTVPFIYHQVKFYWPRW